MSIELQTLEADLHLQDEEQSDQMLKNVEQEIECPRCNDIMTREVVAHEIALKIAETSYLPVRSFGLEEYMDRESHWIMRQVLLFYRQSKNLEEKH